MSQSKPNCPHCHKNTGFQPQTATHAQWLELKSRLRSPQLSYPTSWESLLSAVQDDLRRCQDEINRQQGYLVALENQRKMLERHVEATKALSAPIRQTPPEILSRMFYLACDTNVVGHSQIIVPALGLAAVCSHWRNVILSTREVWSEIKSEIWDPDDVDAYSAQSIVKATEFLLEQSGNHALDVYMHDCTGDVSSDPGWSLILPHCSRWRSLTVVTHLPSLPTYFSTVRGRLPLLEYISISTEDDFDPAEVTEASFDFLKDTPRLRAVSFSGEASTLPIPFPWDQLRSAKLLSQTSGDGLAILSRFSNLREVCIIGGRARLKTLITLDKVCSLELSGISWSLPINILTLDSLILPALTSLFMTNPSSDIDPDVLSQTSFSLDGLLVQSRCKITNLFVRNMPVEITDWLAMLRSLPSLQNLSLYLDSYKSDGKELICDKFFNEMNSTPVLLPKLERLSVTVQYPAIFSSPDIFTNAIQSRWITDYLCDEIACLKYLSLVLPKAKIEPGVIRVLERLAAAGMVVAVKDLRGFVVG
ncbi:hypothetical protein C8J56DRAFT_1164938 [Mycena floridula]|nr:hypothetical protein C8J56DRAFT_1164938 [Mycena floridula]